MYLTKAGQPNAWAEQAVMQTSAQKYSGLENVHNHFVLVGLGVEQLWAASGTETPYKL